LKTKKILDYSIFIIDYLTSMIEHISYLFVVASLVVFLAVFDEKIIVLLLDYIFIYVLFFQIIKNIYFSIKNTIIFKKTSIQINLFIYTLLYLVYKEIVYVEFDFKDYYATFFLTTRFIIYFIYLFLNRKNIKDYFKIIKLNPYQSFTIGFIFLILLGSLLLKLPVSYNGHLSFLDSLFTSTSAVCVTGLTVVNTSDFTFFGKIILLILIQLGAIGIMTFTSFLAIISGSISKTFDRLKSEEIYSETSFKKLKRLIKFIVISTFTIEIFCAIFIFISIKTENINVENPIFFSIFHSISAFSNAGFSTLPNNLIQFYNIIPFNLIIMILIVLGGLGFPVTLNLIEKIKRETKLSLNTKIVLITTFILIITGTLGFYLFEKENLSKYNSVDRILISLFQSVTSRTAGFNTIDISNLSVTTYLLLIFLMFVGASPSSTGGGLKTTTLFLLIFGTYLMIRKKDTPYIFKKKISPSYFYLAGSFLFIRILILFIAITILSLTEKFDIIKIVFESVSALSTVGLSTGITPELSTSGKTVIILLMLIGRIGPLKFLSSFVKTENPNKVRTKIEYLQENIVMD